MNVSKNVIKVKQMLVLSLMIFAICCIQCYSVQIYFQKFFIGYNAFDLPLSFSAVIIVGI